MSKSSYVKDLSNKIYLFTTVSRFYILITYKY